MLRLLGTIRRHGTPAKSSASDSASPKHSIECKVMLLDGTDLTIRLHVRYICCLPRNGIFTQVRNFTEFFRCHQFFRMKPSKSPLGLTGLFFFDL